MPTVDDYAAAIRGDAQLTVAAAAQAGDAAPVPCCPGWTMADLLRHTGGVHRWATEHLVTRPEHVIDLADPRDLAAGRSGQDLLLWFTDGADILVSELLQAPEDLPGATFLPGAGPPRMFWARRQAHETLVHRVDAELAAGDTVTPPDPSLAADGVDELLTGFASRRRALPATARGTLAINATDTGNAWLLRLTDDGPACTAGPGVADVAVSAAAADLQLFLWHREVAAAPPRIEGDASLLAAWLDRLRVI
jgi:uncharacterized protein (TIGR03083 family)